MSDEKPTPAAAWPQVAVLGGVLLAGGGTATAYGSSTLGGLSETLHEVREDVAATNARMEVLRDLSDQVDRVEAGLTATQSSLKRLDGLSGKLDALQVDVANTKAGMRALEGIRVTLDALQRDVTQTQSSVEEWRSRFEHHESRPHIGAEQKAEQIERRLRDLELELVRASEDSAN